MAERESGTASSVAGSNVADAVARAIIPRLHGTLSVFDSTQDNWVEYVECLNYYHVANDIVNSAKKQAILLNTVGPMTYGLITTLCLLGSHKMNPSMT